MVKKVLVVLISLSLIFGLINIFSLNTKDSSYAIKLIFNIVSTGIEVIVLVILWCLIDDDFNHKKRIEALEKDDTKIFNLLYQKFPELKPKQQQNLSKLYENNEFKE